MDLIDSVGVFNWKARIIIVMISKLKEKKIANSSLFSGSISPCLDDHKPYKAIQVETGRWFWVAVVFYQRKVCLPGKSALEILDFVCDSNSTSSISWKISNYFNYEVSFIWILSLTYTSSRPQSTL